MKKILYLSIFLCALALLITCEKFDLSKVTKVETISAIPNLTSAKITGRIVELSDKEHDELGFYYSKNSPPTINDSKVTAGVPKVGEFTVDISGLTSDTKYYIQPFCKEGSTYIFGDIVEVKTGITTFTDFDNNSYVGVQIGTQVWMQENLKVTHYQNGEAIANISGDSQWSNLTTGAYCWYDNKVENKNTYGALYNFYTVADTRNVCPTGWYVPTEAEWTTLIDYLGGDEIAGGKMKLYGLTYWIKPNTDATNSSGFSAIPGGYRSNDGSFNSFGEEAKWWTRTVNDALNSAIHYIYNNYSSIFKENFHKGNGLSIRCIQGEIEGVPLLTTSAVSNITSSSATSGGIITSIGGALVSAKGVCWSTSTKPTVALATKTNNGSGSGIFTSSITGLSQNTTYYVRAYATNSLGTGYGNEFSFTTDPSTVSDNDGNSYNVVRIGTQLWLKENLKTTKYRDGSSIPNITDNTAWTSQTIGAYCWHDNDASTYKNNYGALYNYYTVVDSRNLCPTGWHIPSDTEWTTLETYLGGSSVAGGKLKSNSSLWLSPNTGADNSSGFTALPGGARSDGSGYFINIENYGYWWSSNEYTSTSAWCRQLYYNLAESYRYNYNKKNGFSVRCIKDN